VIAVRLRRQVAAVMLELEEDMPRSDAELPIKGGTRLGSLVGRRLLPSAEAAQAACCDHPACHLVPTRRIAVLVQRHAFSDSITW
jgi:hypothetical protein